MDSRQPEFLLKVLSGPHQGAEVVLHQGNTTVGSNLESDVILSDALIAENHLKVTIAGSQLSITLEADKSAYIEGAPAEEGSHDIRIFQVITLGTTHLVIGPLHETWPQIAIPKLQEPASEEDESEDDDSEDDPNETDEGQDGEENDEDESDDEDKSEETDTPSKEKPVATSPSKKEELATQMLDMVQSKLRSKQWVLGITASAFLFLLFLVILVWPNSPTIKRPERVSLEQAQILVEQKVQTMGLTADIEIEENDDIIAVRGYVSTNAQKRALQSAIKEVNPTFKAQVWSQENLVTGGQEIMAIFSIPVKISSGAPGVIKASGYAPDAQGWEKAKKHLFTDVPGLRGVEDDVLTPQQIHKLTYPILSKYELTSKVFIIPEKNGVSAKGFLSDSVSQIWAQAKPSIEQALGSKVAFKDKVQLTTSAILERIYFDSQIGSITLDGNMSWITLQDGQTYFVGSSLPSGFTVESITRQGVVLKRGKERVTLKTGDR